MGVGEGVALEGNKSGRGRRALGGVTAFGPRKVRPGWREVGACSKSTPRKLRRRANSNGGHSERTPGSARDSQKVLESPSGSGRGAGQFSRLLSVPQRAPEFDTQRCPRSSYFVRRFNVFLCLGRPDVNPPVTPPPYLLKSAESPRRPPSPQGRAGGRSPRATVEATGTAPALWLV